MVDFETLVEQLRERGYNVEHVIELPKNAGDAELVIDGKMFTLEEARALIEDSPKRD